VGRMPEYSTSPVRSPTVFRPATRSSSVLLPAQRRSLATHARLPGAPARTRGSAPARRRFRQRALACAAPQLGSAHGVNSRSWLMHGCA